MSDCIAHVLVSWWGISVIFFLGIFFIKDEIEVGIIYCLWGTFVG
jgi:hypothetical protein